MRLLIKTIILLAISFTAHAKLSIGTSLVYTHINDPDFTYTSEYDQLIKINSINVGTLVREGNFTISVTSNRLLNKSVNRKVRYKGSNYENEIKTTIDSLQLGYIIKRYMPSIFVSNAEIKKKLISKGNIIATQSNNILVYGFGLNYFVDEGSSISINYIMPNNEIYLEGGIALGINFLI